ncbi:hypothetical protein ACFL6G_02055 [candidate division KSB1 bacterium]
MIKSISHVLRSYLQMEFIHLLNLFLGIFYFFIAILKLIQGDAFYESFLSIWQFFLLAILMVSPQLLLQFNRLTRYNFNRLVPAGYNLHLAAMGVILLPLMTFPVLTVWKLGLPLLPHIAMILFIPASIFFFNNIRIYRSYKKSDLDTPGFVFVIFFIIAAYILLDFPHEEIISSTLRNIVDFNIGYDLSIYIFILSILLLGISIIIFIGNTVSGKSRITDNIEPLYVSRQDKMGKIVTNEVYRKLNKLTGMLESEKPSKGQLTRMYQYGLLNPGSQLFPVFFLTFFAAVLLFGSALSLFSSERLSEIFQFIFPTSITWLIVYQIDSGLLTYDFLQHRNRLPALWIRSQLSSRREFTRLVLSAILKTALNRYLAISAAILPVVLIFSNIFVIRTETILLVLSFGILQYIWMISLSLIFSEDIKSSNCIGWSITAIAITAFFWIISTAYWHSSPGADVSILLISGTAVLGVFFLRHAVKDFSQADFDFTGP